MKTNELALLIQCSRSRLAENHKDRISNLLQQEIDWKHVIDSALQHKVILLLQKNLAQYFQNDVPQRVLKDLSALAHSICLRNMALSGALIKTISLLNDNGIEVLPFKGPLLSQRLYGSYTMRLHGDLDILVRKQEIPRSLDILLQNGYSLSPLHIPRAMYDKFMSKAYHGRLVDPNGVTIELHWELSGFFIAPSLTFESVEPYMVKTQFCGRTCLDLRDEMLFFYLCIHGLKHEFTNLDLICSAGELLQSPAGLDWLLIFKLAKEHRIIKGILFSVFLIGKLYNIDKEMESISAILPDITVKCMQSVQEKELDYLFEGEAGYSVADFFDSRSEEIKYYLRAKFIPHQEDWINVRFPPSLFYLYFVNKGYRVLALSLHSRLRRISRLFESDGTERLP